MKEMREKERKSVCVRGGRGEMQRETETEAATETEKETKIVREREREREPAVEQQQHAQQVPRLLAPERERGREGGR